MPDPLLIGIGILAVIGVFLYFKKHPDVQAQVTAAIAPELDKLKGQAAVLEAAAKAHLQAVTTTPAAPALVVSDTKPDTVVVGANVISAPTPSSPTAPTVQRIGGVAFATPIVINPAYKPTMADTIYSGAFSSVERQVVDPSNSPDPAKWPTRSPAGYPLWYGLMPAPGGGTTVVPGFPVMVAYGDQTFPDDAAVASYIARTASADIANAARDANAGATNAVLQPGAYDIRTCNLDDLLFLGSNALTLNNGAKLGPQAVVNQAVNWVAGVGVKPAAIPGLPDLTATNNLLTFNAAAYTGPLKALL